MDGDMQALRAALQSTQSMLLLRFGTDVLTDAQHTLAFLSDYLARDRQSRNRMRLFYESGASGILQQTALPPAQRAQRAASMYVDYTDCSEQLAQRLMYTILAALGEKLEPEPVAGDGDEDLTRAIHETIEEVMAGGDHPESDQPLSPSHTDPYPILRAAMEWKGVWVSWASERTAILERSLDDGRHCHEYERLVKLCKETATRDPDCMHLLAEWYQNGLTTLNHGRLETLVKRDTDQARVWRIKEAAAR